MSFALSFKLFSLPGGVVERNGSDDDMSEEERSGDGEDLNLRYVRRIGQLARFHDSFIVNDINIKINKSMSVCDLAN